MNNDEIVRALRCYASDCNNDDACKQCTFAWMCDKCDGNAPKIIAALIDSLTSQLAKSQRREKAAVEQIEQQMIFDAGAGREPCEICANAEKTPCTHCKPKWRGRRRPGMADNENHVQ